MNQDKPDTKKEHAKRKVTSKQAVAIAGVVLLVLLYVITLITAIVDTSSSQRLFGVCLFSTIAVPLLIWIYTWIYGKMTGKSTMANLKIGGSDHRTDEEIHSSETDHATHGQD